MEDDESRELGPIFTLETVIRTAAGGCGRVTCVAAANNVVVVGTSKAMLVRHDFAEGGSTEVELFTPPSGAPSGVGPAASPPGLSVYRVWADPSGRHSLAAVRDAAGRPCDVWYCHARQPRASTLPRLRGVAVSAACWHRPHVSESGFRESLVATAGGMLYELGVDAKDRREKVLRPVYDLSRSGEPITCLLLESLPAPSTGAGGTPAANATAAAAALASAAAGSPVGAAIAAGGGAPAARFAYLVLAATPTRLFIFRGGPTLDALFAVATGVGGGPTGIQLPGDIPASELQTRGAKPGRRPDRVAWLAAPGVYHARLNLGALLTIPTGQPTHPPSPLSPRTPGLKDAPPAGAVIAALVGIPGNASLGNAPSTPSATANGVIGGATVVAATTAGPLTSSGLMPYRAAGGGDEGARTASRNTTPTRVGDAPAYAPPLALAMTDLHYLVLFGGSAAQSSTLVAYSSITGAPIQTIACGGEPLLGLATDAAAGVIYAYSGASLYELGARGEARHAWRQHLDRGEHAEALAHCSTPQQRDAVLAAQARSAWAVGDLDAAARLYAKCGASPAAPLLGDGLAPGGEPPLSFEAIALALLSAGAHDALATYLAHKVDHVRPGSGQATLIAAWLLELTLHKLARAEETASSAAAMAESAAAAAAANQSNAALATAARSAADTAKIAAAGPRAVGADIERLLTDQKSHLEPSSTRAMLAAHGATRAVIHWASLRDDDAEVVSLHLAAGDTQSALAALRKPRVPPTLWYAHAGALLAAAPAATVEAWLAAGDRLDASRLLPALARCAESGDATARNCAVTYLEHATRGPASAAATHLLLAMHARGDGADESPLLRFLATMVDPATGKPRYDPRAALRLCLEHRRGKAAVQLYAQLGMATEAVALALRVTPGDPQAAMDVAATAEPPASRRRLWLSIARHVIARGDDAVDDPSAPPASPGGVESARVRRALSFVTTAGGALRVEDILPHLPDSARLEDFRGALCASLDDYGAAASAAADDMATAARGAVAVRRDMAALSRRAVTLPARCPCGLCGRALSASPAASLPAKWGWGTPADQPLPPLPPVRESSPPPIYAFPCGHGFHAACATAHASAHAGTTQRALLRELRRMLLPGAEPPAGEWLGHARTAAEAAMALDDLVAAECALCGNLMVRCAALPLIGADESEIKAWAVEP